MKKLFSLLTIALLALSAWADTTVTIDFSAQGYTNAQDFDGQTVTIDGISLSFAKGTGSTTPKYYTSGTSMRLYAGNTMTVSASNTITSIAFTYSQNAWTSDCITVGSYDNGAWTGNASSIVFTNSTGAQVRIKTMVVTVAEGEVLPTCATPTFTPAGGATFEDELDVTINCATEGATITYTVNDDVFEGTAPVTITLTETSAITAIASMDGYNDSPVATANFTKLEPYTVGNVVEFAALTDTVEGGTTAGWHTIIKDGVTMKFYGTVSNYQLTDSAGNVTDEYHQYRIYKNYTIEFTTAAGNIRKIEFDCDASNPVTGFNAVDGLDTDNAIWEGNTRDITFTAGSKQVRANVITVTLDDDAPAIVVADPVIAPANNTRFVNSQEVTITCETEGAAVYYSINDADFQPYTAAFNINETATVKAYAELEGVQSNTVTANYTKLTEVSTIAQANALENNTNFIFYGNVVVVYQNGSNLWVKDNTGYGLIFGSQVPSGIEAGSTLKEEWDAQYTLYRDAINEYQYPSNVAVDEDEPLVEIVATEYTSDQITTDQINERVILKGITLVDGTGKYMYNAADSLVIYNQFNITKPEDFTKAYDVEGMVSYYGGNVQIMPIAITEAASEPEYLRGDVDMSGDVKISDVTALINYLLSGDATGISVQAADCDLNGEIKIGDVTALINYLLSGSWE